MDFIIYQVKPNETLTSISNRIDIPEEYLKDFHNQNCGDRYKIWLSNLKGIKEICVPLNYISVEEQEQKIAKLLPNKTFTADFYFNEYSVTERIKTSESEINVESKITLNFPKNESVNVVEITRDSFQNSKNKTEDKMSVLGIDCMMAISPIPFTIEENGKLSGNFNHHDILSRYKNNKEKIIDFHTGEVTDSYLNLFEENLQNEAYFFKQMANSLLYQTLFPKRSNFHKRDKWREEFVIYQNSFPISFEFDLDIDISDAKIVVTTIKGKIKEDLELYEVVRGIKSEENRNSTDSTFDSEIQLRYTTNKASKKLISANGKITLWDEQEIYEEHQIVIEKA